MKSYVLLLLAVGFLSVSGCRETDVRTLTVNVPALSSDADVERIKKALTPLSGIDKAKVVFDVAGHKVVVTYDSMVLAHKNIEIAIAEAGFDANEIRAIRAASK